jgi:AraC family transcriptional regulator, ethanolamine operon transcriptional activator
MVAVSAAPAVDSGLRTPSDDDVAPFSVTRTSSSDIDEQAASLREWNQVYEQITPGRFIGGLHEMCFPRVQLFRETTNQAVHECGTPWRGSRAIGVPLRMEGTALFRGESVTEGAMVTLGPDDELDFYTPRSFEILGLVVDADALDTHSRQVEHRDLPAAFAGKGVLVPGSQRLDEFRRLLLSVLQSLDVNPNALQFRQTQRLLEQTIFAALVAVVADDGESSKPPCAGRQHVVDAAHAFMRSHIAEPITVADLCVALGVSRRTLQYSFHEVLGINPVRFLRAMRLNGVRRDLKASTRPAESVQDIAARWGFWHLGHFVTDYKRMFGELPSDTLRHKRPRTIRDAG